MDKTKLIEVLNKTKQKKVIIAAATILIILIAIIAASIEPTPAEQPTLTPTPTPITQGQVTGQPISQISQSPNNRIPKWHTYAASTITIPFPNEWSAHPAELVGGGELITIKPNILPQQVNYPRLLVEIQTASEIRMKQKIEVLKALGLTPSQEIILEQPATKVSGTLPFKEVAGKKVDEPIQETNILFTQGNKMYLLKYQYEGATQNPAMEEYFSNFIQGIQLK